MLSSAAVDFNADGYPDVVTCGIGYVGYLKHCASSCPVRGIRFDYISIDDAVDIVDRCPVITSSAGGGNTTGVRAVVAFTGRAIHVYEATGTFAHPEWTLETPIYRNVSSVAGTVGELSTNFPFENREFREAVWVETARRTELYVGEVFTGLEDIGSYMPAVVSFGETVEDQMSAVYIVDIDEDQYADVLAVSRLSYSVFWFRNSVVDGNMVLSEPRYILTNELRGVENVVMADVDLGKLTTTTFLLMGFSVLFWR